MTDLTHILGKPFRRGGRGPNSYDCVGVAKEAVRSILGDEAAETIPCGLTTCVMPEEFPGEWCRVGDFIGTMRDGEIVLTERDAEDGLVEHHLYVRVASGKLATCDRERGVVVVPDRVIPTCPKEGQERVIGVYRYGGAQ